MAKIDKGLYTKEEWRRLKEQRRLQKEAKLFESSDTSKYFVLCLKHGTKYSAEYVNKLFRMVSRNCSLEFSFFCITDDPKNLDDNIKTIPTPPGLTGWWCKPYIFAKELPIDGTILYMDLDVVISGNIDKLFTYQPYHWCIVRDFTRVMRPKWQKYNSSIIKFCAGELDFVWQDFKKDPISIQRRFFGDQDYLYDATYKRKAAMLYPDSWVQSWKWEVRKDRTFAPGGVRGKRKLKYIEHVTPTVECCVCVFHGDPNPEHCEDPWVVDNWR